MNRTDMSVFSMDAREAILRAQHEAGQLQKNEVSLVHLVLGLISEPRGTAGQFLREMEMTLKSAREAAEFVEAMGASIAMRDNIPLSDDASNAANRAVQRSRNLGSQECTAGHILLEIAEMNDPIVARLFARCGLDNAGVAKEIRDRMQVLA